MIVAPSTTSTDVRSRLIGDLHLDVTHYEQTGHTALRVYAGEHGPEHPGLAFTSDNGQAFADRCRLIATAASYGVKADDIALYVQQAIAEDERQIAVKAGDDSRVRQLDHLLPTLLTDEQRQGFADIAAHLARVNEASEKQQASKRNFADLNLGGHNTYLARKNTRVNFDDPSPAQLELLKACAANDGYVPVGDATDERTMRAAARKMLGELVYRMVGKRQVVKGFRASQRGLKAVSA